MKEAMHATLNGENLREKVRKLKMADPRLLEASSSRIVTIAFEHFYEEVMTKRQHLKKEESGSLEMGTCLNPVRVVSPVFLMVKKAGSTVLLQSYQEEIYTV